MKKLLCLLLLCCLCLTAFAETAGEYTRLYHSRAASRAGETVTFSKPLAQLTGTDAWPAQVDPFSLGAGNTFVQLQQGMLIIEHTAQSKGDRFDVSFRTEDETGAPVFELLLEQFAKDGAATLRALYCYADGEWELEFLP
ncbi:MAG: hypothetical protein IKW00_08055 [Clostridia bacterium]|nr:hypothetical protein [Clostridia bacterium]